MGSLCLWWWRLEILSLKESTAQTVMVQSMNGDIPDNYIPPDLLVPSSSPVMNQVSDVQLNQFPVLDAVLATNQGLGVDLGANQVPALDINQIGPVELSQQAGRSRRGRLSRLCAAVSCRRGSVCRVVQQCRSCTPRAECVDRDAIPFVADDICQSQNFQEAILIESFRNQFSYRGLPCSPNSASSFDSCPDRSTCVTGRRGRGRCCFGRFGFPGGADKPGFCPRVFPGFPGVCGGQFCSRDSSCRGSQKCCRSPCGGNTCTRPVFPGQSQGCGGGCPRGTVCTRVPVNCIRPPCDNFSFQCVRDRQPGGDGLGQCPAPSRSFCSSINSIDQCTSDFQCSRNQRCCFDGCSRNCEFTRFF